MSALDNSEISKIEWRLKNCTKRLHELAPMLGAAKQVRDYDSDRRKNLLARYVVKHLKLGESATAAEQYARADDAFNAELDVLATQRGSSEKTIAENDAEYASFEACRSLMSMAKESLKTFQEWNLDNKRINSATESKAYAVYVRPKLSPVPGIASITWLHSVNASAGTTVASVGTRTLNLIG